MATANRNAILAMLGINTAVGAVNQVASKAMMKKMNPLSAPDPAALQVVKDYLSRNKIKGVSILESFDMMDQMGPHYNPITRSIWTGANANPFLGLHEAGHAKTWSRLPSGAAIAPRVLFALGGLGGVGMAFSGNEKAEKLAPWVAAGTSVPVLADEAIASGRALKEMARLYGWKKALRVSKIGLPAFMTYLLAAGGGVGAAAAISAIRKKAREESM